MGMTRRLWLGGENPEPPKPVAVHGCAYLGADAPPAIERQTLGNVVAGGVAARMSPPAPVAELSRTLAFGLARAPVLPHVVVARAEPAAPSSTPARVASSAPAAAPRRGSEPPRSPPVNGLFRREVLDALHGVSSPEAEAKLPKPSAYGWGVLLVLASLALFVFGGAAVAKVEVTVVAFGALRDPKGVRAVAATLAGTVAEVLVRAGDEVREGHVLARLELAQLEATLKLREQELAVLEKEATRAERADAVYSRQTSRALRRRRAVMRRRSSLNQAIENQRRDQLARMSESVREGVASVNQELRIRESLQQALDAEQLLRSSVADIDVQLADIADRLESRARARRTEHARAVAAVAAARALIQQATIVAPAAGRVESLLVAAGSVVAPGRQLAQIVPSGAPRSIVAFLPSRETAFVSVGSRARVEVESLPVSEFGQASAEVARISTDIAKPEELVAQFGEAKRGSFVRVELELLPGNETAQMAPHLRSGELVKVRLHRRERRIISLMFEFARTWLGP